MQAALHPKPHADRRDSRVPVLAVWGHNDELFGPDGTRAFAEDAADAEVRLPDGGHFLLESQLDTAAGYTGAPKSQVSGLGLASPGYA